jgi:hypothetical protein
VWEMEEKAEGAVFYGPRDRLQKPLRPLRDRLYYLAAWKPGATHKRGNTAGPLTRPLGTISAGSQPPELDQTF